MRYAIVYESKTGNTKQLADVIPTVLGEAGCLYIGAPKNHIEVDVLFVGAWIDKGVFAESIIAYLQQLHHQRLVFFGTAGFGQSKEYFDAIIHRSLQQLPQDNEVLGSFLCQGKMEMRVKARYQSMLEKDPQNRKFQNLLENFDQALAHPSQEDLDNFKTFLKGLHL